MEPSLQLVVHQERLVGQWNGASRSGCSGAGAAELLARPCRCRPSCFTSAACARLPDGTEPKSRSGASWRGTCRHHHRRHHRPVSAWGRCRSASSVAASAASIRSGCRLVATPGFGGPVTTRSGGHARGPAACPARDGKAWAMVSPAFSADGGTRGGSRGRARRLDTSAPAHPGTSVSTMRRVASYGSAVSNVAGLTRCLSAFGR